MSIVRQLIQICMVEAIRGRTVAADGILDSNIAGIGQLDFKESQPVIAVSVEESDQNDKGGHGFFGRSADLKLYVQIAVAVKGTYVIVTGEGAEREEEIAEIGATDAAREATLNILDRQWKQVLVDPDNVWGDRFRQLVPMIGRVQDTRITDPEGGRKYAARVYEISGTAIAEPDFGAALPADIDAILAAVGQTEGYGHIETIWRDVFAKSTLASAGGRLQATAQLSSTAYAALGLNVPDAAGAPFGGATVAVEGLDEVATPGPADSIWDGDEDWCG